MLLFFCLFWQFSFFLNVEKLFPSFPFSCPSSILILLLLPLHNSRPVHLWLPQCSGSGDGRLSRRSHGRPVAHLRKERSERRVMSKSVRVLYVKHGKYALYLQQQLSGEPSKCLRAVVWMCSSYWTHREASLKRALNCPEKQLSLWSITKVNCIFYLFVFTSCLFNVFCWLFFALLASKR